MEKQQDVNQKLETKLERKSLRRLKISDFIYVLKIKDFSFRIAGSD